MWLALFALVVRLFLATVLLAAALSKRSGLAASFSAYELWAPGLAQLVDRALPIVEGAVAATLLLHSTAGLCLASLLFLVFGHVQVMALAAGYQGNCGCGRRSERVSAVGVARSYVWTLISFSLIALQTSIAPVVFLAALSVTALLAVVGVLAPGARLRAR